VTFALVEKGFVRMNDKLRVGVLAASAMLVYGNTLRNSFTFDDGYYILHHHAVTTFSIPELFRPTSNNIFRPVTYFTFALNWALEGAHPFGYHLVNLLLHAWVTLLLYLLLQQLFQPLPSGTTLAFASALLFAVHPIHAEAVASITGRSELLAAGFLLAAWLSHLYDWQVPALVCLVVGVLSKESALAFLPLVIAGDYIRGKLKPFARYGWIGAISVLYVLLYWKVEGGRFGAVTVSFLDNPLVSFPPDLRILNALRIAWKYIGLQLYPATLSYDYSYNAIPLYSNWQHAWLAVVGTLGVLTAWFWTLWSRRWGWFLAGVIYMAGFAVTSNIIVPTGTIMAERLTYFPSAGLCLLVALIWIQLEKRRAPFAWTILSILVATLGVRTMVRNQDWENNFKLFSSGVRAVPSSARAHRNLADEYVHLGQFESARAEFQTAVRIYPDYPEVLENYGLLEARLGHDDEARRLLETAVSMTTSGSPDYAFMKVNLAAQLMKMGQSDEALKLLSQVIADWPGYPPAWSNRALIRYQRGDRAGARADDSAALRLDPSNAQALSLRNILSAPAAGASADY
jgi:Tfp pilus assembly protein PilF